MPNNKKNILERKVPFNLSIRKVIVLNFEEYCLNLGIDKSAMVESMIKELLYEEKFSKEQ